MDERYICYCGLYCENCGVKARIHPAAKVLYDKMRTCGFEDVMPMLPGGDGFWTFLKSMVENGMCTSCREGGGDPGCAVRICAKEKGVEVCAFCKEYPCKLFDRFFTNLPTLIDDNVLLKEKGMKAWAKLQDERRAKDFVYVDEKQ
jgi:hypothetical protein